MAVRARDGDKLIFNVFQFVCTVEETCGKLFFQLFNTIILRASLKIMKIGVPRVESMLVGVYCEGGQLSLSRQKL